MSLIRRSAAVLWGGLVTVASLQALHASAGLPERSGSVRLAAYNPPPPHRFNSE